MESEKYYQTLNSFLSSSGVSVVEFADQIRMFSEMFKELLNTKSKMTIGTFMSVAVGCKSIIDEQTDEQKRTQLQELYSRFYDEYLTECPEAFLTIPNPHFIRRIEEMAEAADPKVYAKVHHIFHPDSEIPNEPAIQKEIPEDLRTKLDVLMNQLNREGQQEVLKRVKELTFVPAYQRKD